MVRALIVTLASLCLPMLASCCYDNCIKTFSAEVDKHGHTLNTTALTRNFCRAMSNQIQCLTQAIPKCTTESKALIQSMLNIFIWPDYQRTCSVSVPSNNDSMIVTTSAPKGISMGDRSTVGGGTIPTINTLPMMPGFPGTSRISREMILLCSQKVKKCQATFPNDHDGFNISGACQTLKQVTLCFVNLLSSDCGQVVSRTLVTNMQTHYGTVCSTDAQANTNTLLECTSKTLACFAQFNSTFLPAVADYNLVLMCGSIQDYTDCVQNVSQTQECAQLTSQSLAGISRLKARNNAFCGDDNGQTAHLCVEAFQDCYVPFNDTFFPALHQGDLSLMCQSLQTHRSCVTRLKPSCSQQLGQAIRSVEALRQQFAEKCHPNILKLATCKPVGQCSQMFMASVGTKIFTSSGLCGTIGSYFPCVAQGLDDCKLPQSTTEVEFGDLGILMKQYCDKISSNALLLQCPAFVKCTTAIMMSFSPNVKNMFEGSTWCTFLQLSLGCAEHALQSTGCHLEGDQALQDYVTQLDNKRMNTCERGGSGGTLHVSMVATTLTFALLIVNVLGCITFQL